MKIRKEMLFGFGIMALIVLPSVLFMPWVIAIGRPPGPCKLVM